MTRRRGFAVPSRAAAGWAGLAVVLAVVAGVATVAHRPPQLAGFALLPWWGLAILFTITEISALTVRLWRRNLALSFTDVPLVMGLFLATPSALIVGRLVASLAVALLYRRRSPLDTLRSTVLTLAGTAAAELTFLSVLAGAGPLGLRGGLAAVLAACVGALVVTGGAVRDRLEGGGAPWRAEAGRVMVPAVGTAAVVALIGLVPVTAFSNGAAALPATVLGALALLGYRAIATLSDRQVRLERLYKLSDALAGAPGSADVVRSVLGQSADLLGADYAELLFTGADAHLWWLRTGQSVHGPVRPEAAHHSLPIPPGGLIGMTGSDPAQRAFLAARGITEAIAVRLRIADDDAAGTGTGDNVGTGEAAGAGEGGRGKGGGSITGHLLVGDRLGEDRGFRAGDVRLLETVANHASVALRNGRLIEQLHFEARHDELTHLPNRLHLRGLLDEVAAATCQDVPCAVMVLDFNGFKAINDTLGHPAGDELLRVLGGRFQQAVGPGAVVARLGGDEFAVLAQGIDAAGAQRLAARLLGAFDEPVLLAGTRLRVGGSLGIALGPEHGTTGADLLRKADVAMYVAKSAADGWRMYHATMTITSPQELALTSDLRDAIRADQIGIVVQPLIDLAAGTVHSLEVLARWQHPELGEIPPAEFFAAAERSGQLPALSKRILDAALAACRVWIDAGLRLRVTVNLAPRWPTDSSLPDQIGRALSVHQVPADLLGLEITEDAAFAEPERAQELLRRLRSMGVHLSVDDFGTGSSSLTFLSRLAVDQLKIHQSFVERIHDSGRDQAIVQSIIDLGRNLGLEVVAEGVTDQESRRLLQRMGCQLAQGYLFTAPIGVQEVPALIRRTAQLGWADGPVRRPAHLDTLG